MRFFIFHLILILFFSTKVLADTIDSKNRENVEFEISFLSVDGAYPSYLELPTKLRVLYQLKKKVLLGFGFENGIQLSHYYNPYSSFFLTSDVILLDWRNIQFILSNELGVISVMEDVGIAGPEYGYYTTLGIHSQSGINFYYSLSPNASLFCSFHVWPLTFLMLPYFSPFDNFAYTPLYSGSIGVKVPLLSTSKRINNKETNRNLSIGMNYNLISWKNNRMLVPDNSYSRLYPNVFFYKNKVIPTIEISFNNKNKSSHVFGIEFTLPNEHNMECGDISSKYINTKAFYAYYEYDIYLAMHKYIHPFVGLKSLFGINESQIRTYNQSTIHVNNSEIDVTQFNKSIIGQMVLGANIRIHGKSIKAGVTMNMIGCVDSQMTQIGNFNDYDNPKFSRKYNNSFNETVFLNPISFVKNKLAYKDISIKLGFNI